jgi:hypothetical protein
MPAEISARVVNSTYGLDTVTYTGPDGNKIIRPPGLFDNPGAVAGPATFAGLLGVVFATAPGPIPFRIGAALLAVAGVAAIYLSFVRTSLVILLGMFVVYMVLLVRKREFGRMLFVIPLVLTVGASYGNSGRAEQLQYGITELAIEYPLGAGLGRWGTMQDYFGDPLSPTAPPLWAELQPNAWILDGGLLLVALYAIALIVTTRHDLALLRATRHPDLQRLAAAVIAVNAGVLALMFGFTPFTNQIGTQFWLLTGVLHGAAQREKAR